MRIIKNGGKVYFAKDTLITVAKLKTPEDVDPEGDERRPMSNIKRLSVLFG